MEDRTYTMGPTQVIYCSHSANADYCEKYYTRPYPIKRVQIYAWILQRAPNQEICSPHHIKTIVFDMFKIFENV